MRYPYMYFDLDDFEWTIQVDKYTAYAEYDSLDDCIEDYKKILGYDCGA